MILRLKTCFKDQSQQSMIYRIIVNNNAPIIKKLISKFLLYRIKMFVKYKIPKFEIIYSLIHMFYEQVMFYFMNNLILNKMIKNLSTIIFILNHSNRIHAHSKNLHNKE